MKHRFLCDLGPSFETFSTAHHVIKPRPSFHNLLSQTESHKLFFRFVNGIVVRPVAFNAQASNSFTSSSRRASTHRGRGNCFSGSGRGCRSPHCQLCRKDVHYATQCPDLSTFAHRGPSIDANLA